MTDYAALDLLRAEAAAPSLRLPNPAAERLDDITWREHLSSPVATPTLGWVRGDVSHIEREPLRLRIVDAATELLMAYVHPRDRSHADVLVALADGQQEYQRQVTREQWQREQHDFPLVSRRPQCNRWPIQWRPIRRTKHHAPGVISDQVWTPAYGSVVARVALSPVAYDDDFEFAATITQPRGQVLGSVNHIHYYMDSLPPAIAVASCELVLRRLARDDIDAMVCSDEWPTKQCAEAGGVYLSEF